MPLRDAPPFSQSGTKALPDLWWTELNDEALNAHISYALNNNFSLASTWQRLKAARAVARRQSSGLYPDLDLVAGAAYQEGDTIEGDNDDNESYTFGPEATYEVDLWGRIRSRAQAEALRAQATQEEYRTAALSLSADIALTWINLVETQNQLYLLDRQIETNEKVLEVLRAQFGAGQVRSQDILRQQLLIEAIREDAIAFEADMHTLEHQLAVLRGDAPQSRNYNPGKKLPALPARPQMGLPAELIQRRPDVRRAYLDIRAADRDLAAAIRNQYPRLDLTASYLTDADTAGNLLSNWITTLAASLVAPVLDGGQRRAEIDRTQAVRAQLINTYGQTVLEAFRDVEDALIQEDKQRRRIANLEGRLAIARDTYDQIRTGYFNGANAFIAVLEALDELQQIERDLLRAQRDLIAFRIALYRALAGGFVTPREMPETEDAQTIKTNDEESEIE